MKITAIVIKIIRMPSAYASKYTQVQFLGYDPNMGVYLVLDVEVLMIKVWDVGMRCLIIGWDNKQAVDLIM